MQNEAFNGVFPQTLMLAEFSVFATGQYLDQYS